MYGFAMNTPSAFAGPDAPGDSPAPDRFGSGPMPEPHWMTDTRRSYDTVAASYADLMRDSLDEQPVVRHLLALFAELVRATGAGPVADIGCGTGRVTARLRGLGLNAFGVDLSPGMITAARREHPEVRFEVDSMTDLKLADASVAGLVAWFSIIHVPDDEVRQAFRQFRRVLSPHGVLMLGFYVGDATTRKTQGYGGHPMKVDLHRRPVARVVEWLSEAGFRTDVEMLHHADETTTGGTVIARRAD
jgi:SAM-dependent methyltransferase